MDGKTINVLPKEVSYDPISDDPIHIDFLRIVKGTKLTLEIPVRFINGEKSPGLKKGGVLNIVRRKIELKCPAENIPKLSPKFFSTPKSKKKFARFARNFKLAKTLPE